MQAVEFRSLPLLVRVATMMSFFMLWVLIAELVIDRHGLDRYLPFYRVGNLCPYDLGVTLCLLIAWLRVNRSRDG